MPKVVAVLGDEAALGFSLTGMDVIRVSSPAAARAVLREVARKCASDAGQNREYGLLIVEEALFAALEPAQREALLALEAPLVIPVRIDLRWAPEGQRQADDAVAGLIRHAVGYQLNIQL